MDIIMGSGKNRQKIATIPSGYRMRQMEKNEPIEYVKARGGLMTLVRNQST